MGFPFIAPLKPWIKTKLTNREKFSYETHRLSPFAILSSGAVVTNNRTNINETIKSGNYTGAYLGCVISNQSEFTKMYQTSNTILGYDLEGKAIKIEGESDRKISTPIIQSVEIDTDGGNNTLKSAHVKIKCFSLKQLEMFDLFFLRASMNVILEYGWNTDIIGKTAIDSVLFAKKNHENYVKAFVELFDDAKVAKTTYLDTLVTTDGNYDYMAGKVTGYTYSPVEDGTYDIDLEISAGNELQLWMPMKQSNEQTAVGKKGVVVELPYATWLRKLSADFNLPAIIDLPEAKWKTEFFNWDMLNAKEKDKVASYEPYISFELILELLQNSQIFKTKPNTITINCFEDAAKTKRLIPMNSNKYMISSSEDIIIPNKLPKFAFSSDPDKKNVLIIDENKPPEECSINGKSFNLPEKTSKMYNLKGEIEPLDDKKVYGNLLNMFFNYNTILNIYNQSFTQADFINGVLGIVNENTYGLCKLEIMSISDGGDVGSKILQIMDYKLFQKPASITESEKPYRFKIGPISGTIKEFNFSMELSELAQSQALYQSQLTLNNIMAGKGLAITGSNAQLQTEDYSLFDLSYAKNSDGWFSINEVEKKIVIQSSENTRIKTETFGTEQAKPTNTAAKEVQNIEEVVKQKSVKFKIKKSGKDTIKTYIFLDAGVIKSKIGTNDEAGSALTYLDISLAIDGMAGLSCGEYFQIDGIPEIYNKNGIFQITNVKQGIDDSGWKTTIEAGYRVNIEAVTPVTPTTN
jgi:hypothetical protein